MSHSIKKKINNVLQESRKLNAPTGINSIINFYDISKTLVYNIAKLNLCNHECF